MSSLALRDLNTIPASEWKNESSSKGSFTKPCEEHSNLEEKNKKSTDFSVSNSINGDANVSSEIEVVAFEVEYIESEDLNDVEDADTSLKTLLAGLESNDWIALCEALNDVRRLCKFHKDALFNILLSERENLIVLIAKSLKNPRSAVCKTAIMTCADIFKAYNDEIIDSLEPLLVQLLLKSSQDKKFVCEAAEKALIAMTTWVSPILLLPKLQPNLKHRNPRIRAKASTCFSSSVPRLGVEGIKEYGIDKLLQIAATQLSDKLPESREAARALLLELQTVYENSFVAIQSDVPEELEVSSWETFCQSKLSPLSAQAVIRVTSVNREGLTTGC